MRLFFSLISLLFLGVSVQPASSEELRPITHEDVWTMNRLGSPVLSPDGQLAVVSVTEPSYEKDADISDLWVIPHILKYALWVKPRWTIIGYFYLNKRKNNFF